MTWEGRFVGGGLSKMVGSGRLTPQIAGTWEVETYILKFGTPM